MRVLLLSEAVDPNARRARLKSLLKYAAAKVTQGREFKKAADAADKQSVGHFFAATSHDTPEYEREVHARKFKNTARLTQIRDTDATATKWKGYRASSIVRKFLSKKGSKKRALNHSRSAFYAGGFLARPGTARRERYDRASAAYRAHKGP